MDRPEPHEIDLSSGAIKVWTLDEEPPRESIGHESRPIELAIPMPERGEGPLTLDALRIGLAESIRYELLDPDQHVQVREILTALEAMEDPRPFLGQLESRFADYGVGFVELTMPPDVRMN